MILSSKLDPTATKINAHLASQFTHLLQSYMSFLKTGNSWRCTCADGLDSWSQYSGKWKSRPMESRGL